MNNKEELLISCLEMPKLRLMNLLERDHKKILDIELSIVNDWIDNERCECAKAPEIKNREISLDCEHLNKEINKKTKKIEESIEIKSNALILKNLGKSKRFRQSFHTFKI